MAKVNAAPHQQVIAGAVSACFHNTPEDQAKLVAAFCAAPDDALFDEVTIAAYLDCSTAKLQRDRWAGIGLPFIKLSGRLVRYRAGSVRNALLESRPVCRAPDERVAA